MCVDTLVIFNTFPAILTNVVLAVSKLEVSCILYNYLGLILKKLYASEKCMDPIKLPDEIFVPTAIFTLFSFKWKSR